MQIHVYYSTVFFKVSNKIKTDYHKKKIIIIHNHVVPFYEIGQHYNLFDVLLPNHQPKVSNCVLFWPCKQKCRNVQGVLTLKKKQHYIRSFKNCNIVRLKTNLKQVYLPCVAMYIFSSVIP